MMPRNMSAKTTEEKIAVMQAHIHGKKIEYRARGEPEWYPVYEPIWDWLNVDYRIAQLTFPIKIVRSGMYTNKSPETINSVAELPIGEPFRILPQ